MLVSSTGVPGANGGLLGRQMAMRRQLAPVGTPGPGTHEVAKGMGAARSVPEYGLPRQRPFYSPHLRALGSLRPATPAEPTPWGGTMGPAPAERAWTAETLGSPTARFISYAPVPATPAHSVG